MRNLSACQLLLDPPAEGAWNMAVDEVLFDAAAHSNQLALRFYQWQSPTLSLGYFQKYVDRSRHPASLSVDVVRRLSGGGAIMHDCELTYSFVLPASHDLSHDTQTLYDTVHQAIVEAMNKSFLSAFDPTTSWQPVLCDLATKLAPQDEPFLCFQRRATGDILLRKPAADFSGPTHKIVGSAQRRRRGAVLQHGSILFGQSKVAPELKGLAELIPGKISPADLLPVLLDSFAKNLSLDLIKKTLPSTLSSQAHKLKKKKYLAPSWSKRR